MPIIIRHEYTLLVIFLTLLFYEKPTNYYIKARSRRYLEDEDHTSNYNNQRIISDNDNFSDGYSYDRRRNDDDRETWGKYPSEKTKSDPQHMDDTHNRDIKIENSVEDNHNMQKAANIASEKDTWRKYPSEKIKSDPQHMDDTYNRDIKIENSGEDYHNIQKAAYIASDKANDSSVDRQDSVRDKNILKKTNTDINNNGLYEDDERLQKIRDQDQNDDKNKESTKSESDEPPQTKKYCPKCGQCENCEELAPKNNYTNNEMQAKVGIENNQSRKDPKENTTNTGDEYISKVDNETSEKEQKIIPKDKKNFIRFNDYCRTNYSRPKQQENMVLKKLIVIFRNGDRVPFFIENTNWKNMHCRLCKSDSNKIHESTEKKCEIGDLTRRGYIQMQDLGFFIKNGYRELDFKRIKSRSTSLPRTQTSLHGVLNAILDLKEFSDIDIIPREKDSLVFQNNCRYVNNLLGESNYDYFNDIKIKYDQYFKDIVIPPQNIADIYISSFCNSIPIDCSHYSCRDEVIEDYISTELKSWDEQTKKVIDDKEINKIMFGRFASDLEKMLKDEKTSLYLISTNDLSLSMVLNGLGAEMIKQPPYASAIFLEVWYDKNHQNKLNKGSRNFGVGEGETDVESEPKYKDLYLRTIFLNKIMKLNSYNDINVPLNEILNNLSTQKMTDKVFQEKCDS